MRKKGRIKFFNKQKKFGFIIDESGGADIFIHISGIRGGIVPEKNERIEFSVRNGRKGKEACNAVLPDRVAASPEAVSETVNARRPQDPPEIFPFTFVSRPVPEKTSLPRFHDRLADGCADIALEVRWTALTPVAANPVRTPEVGESCVPGNNDDFKGFNRRWLMVNNLPVISPFTVKGALANGVANLLGSCYRINDQEVPHSDNLDQGQYPYTGIWKRYRVPMNNSQPAILRAKPRDGRDERGRPVKILTIQPVREIYCDFEPDDITLVPHKAYRADLQDRSYKYFIRPNSLGEKSIRESGGNQEIFYHGPYTFGMNCGLEAPAKGKKHLHRFYQFDGEEITFRLPAERFDSLDELKAKVYMGGMSPNGRTGRLWYEDLSGLDENDWIYFHTADGTRETIIDIGRNFLFKSLFLHSDTIPPGQEPCASLTALCPRCSLFGMAETTSEVDSGPNGFRGRFRSAGLVGTQHLGTGEEGGPYPLPGSEPPCEVRPLYWRSEHNEILARQVLLPIQGVPKANKRSKDGKGYYNSSGKLHGAKKTRHGRVDLDDLIRKTDRRPNPDEEKYSHKLRNWAMVCSEGMTFQGVLEVENCSLEELAALLLLLHGGTPGQDFADGSGHGFKIGLGKSFGLGTLVSTVRTAWVRLPRDYVWQRESFDSSVPVTLDAILERLEQVLPGISEAVNDLKNTGQLLERLDRIEQGLEQSLSFPKPGNNYWRSFTL